MDLNATIFGQAIAFFFFVLFCMKYVLPPLMGAIEKRQKEIADGLAFTERAKKDLEIAQAEANNHLQQAKAKAKTIIEIANKRRTEMLYETKAAAEAERKKILMQAKMEIDTEYRRVREELLKQVSILALAGIEKIMERSIDKIDDSDIIDKIINEL